MKRADYYVIEASNFGLLMIGVLKKSGCCRRLFIADSGMPNAPRSLSLKFMPPNKQRLRPPWHQSLSCCRGKEGETEDEILREKEWMQEKKTGRPQAGARVLILKKVRENTLLLYYRLLVIG